MYYIWHYGISDPRVSEFEDILFSNYAIQCKKVYSIDKDTVVFISFDVPEIHPQFEEIIHLISNRAWKDNATSPRPSVYFPVYSEEEYLSAKWLNVRSSFSKVLVENKREIIRQTCIFGEDRLGYTRGMHAEESGTCIVKSPIKWHRNHFASATNISEYFLFCDDTVRSILLQKNVTGIDFRPVIRQSSMLPVDNIHQMSNLFTVPDCGIIGKEYTTEHVCKSCGMRMVNFHDPRFSYAILNGSIPDGLDYCRTPPLFLGYNIEKTYGAFSTTLISQRLYRIIKDNMLDRGLWFEPIDTIEG